MKTIVHIIGNRPQFIKLAALYPELNKYFKQKIIHTGQHFDHNMSEIFFEQLNIPTPDINLHIRDSSPYIFIGKAAEELSKIFNKNQDSIAFVYGDTNTTLAGAVAAKRSNILLIHFEAGVRTGAQDMPEETNRIITDRLADINYCCTDYCLQNMIAEGYGNAINSVAVNTGDLMLDTFLHTPQEDENYNNIKNYVSCTIHRAENLRDKNKLSAIVEALNEINKLIPVIFAIHPHTQKKLNEHNITPLFKMIKPLGYTEMQGFLKNAECIITDSGGVSREAYFLKKKSLIIMAKPFWPEIIKDKCSLNVAADKGSIINAFKNLNSLQPDFNKQIFGDGNAAVKISEHLSQYLYTN